MDERSTGVTAAENRETPLAESQSWVTPNRLFFVRSHFDAPDVAPEDWKLTVEGCVGRELELTWQQLNSLPQRSVFATLECAGNGRSFLTPKVEGVQWRAGAVGHAEWSGVPLKYVLEQAGLTEDAGEILFEGADSGMEKGADAPISFLRSLPLEKALHQDTLLATRMNGEPLEASHGKPVRLIVPGWYGVASVKWLKRIEAIGGPFQGYFQSKKYTFREQTGSGTQTVVVGPMPVKSEIIRPTDGATLGVGTNRIFGMAWAGEDAVGTVEVSVDGGESWKQAELIGPRAPYSWTLWEYLWEVAGAGETVLMSRAISEGGSVQPTRHNPLRGGYMITFSRETHVRVDPRQRSQDSLGDIRSLHMEMAAAAEAASGLPLDVEMQFEMGAGI